MLYVRKFFKKIGNLCRRVQRVGDRVNPLVFMHIPKCAGTSLLNALSSKYLDFFEGYVDGPTSRKDMSLILGSDTRSLFNESLLYGVRQREMLRRADDGYAALSGHVPISRVMLNLFKMKYLCVTIVREPVERWMSAWAFRYSKKTLPSDVLQLEGKGLKAMIEQYLCSDDAIVEASIVTDFFAGTGFQQFHDQRLKSEIALSNAMHFDLIGDVKSYDYFLDQLSDRLQMNLMKSQLNATKTRISARYSVEEVMVDLKSYSDRICDLCSQDIELYDQLFRNNLVLSNV